MADFKKLSMPSPSLDEKIKELENKLSESKECSPISPRSNQISTPSPHRRPGRLPVPPRPRKILDLPVPFVPPKEPDHVEIDRKMKEIMTLTGILDINGQKYKTDIKDLEHLGELGNGTCGHVVKMLHKPSNTVIAVKQMRRSGNQEENKRIIMDLEVVLKSHDCPFIVQCLGCFITDSDVWICMELMATCFDKLLKRLNICVPEDILGKVTYDTVRALDYLKEQHGVIHRDVKPSNILLSEKGNVKLCDFGISGRLVDSKAQTRSAGCAAYMAPERIAPPDPNKPAYDIRADVWSLGITLIELATGVFPYSFCKSDFEVLAKVVDENPPTLPLDKNFSPEFRDFVKGCLTKNYRHRPKYKELLKLPFMVNAANSKVDVAEWFAKTVPTSDINLTGSSPIRRFTPPPASQVTRHHRSSSETSRVPEALPSGRYSPFQRLLSTELKAASQEPSVDMNNSSSRFDSSHKSSSPVLWQANCDNASQNSRKRFSSVEPPQSPMLLQRFLHQQSRFSNFNQQWNYSPPTYNNYTPEINPTPQSYYSNQSSTSHTSEFNQADSSKVDETNNGIGKKRFSSYLKFHLGGSKEETKRNNGLPPLHRSTRQGSPVPLTYVSSQSPEPPPRLNRVTTQGQENGSPLVVRRFLDHSPIRRGIEASSSLSRRYISPSPPQPPPRRLTECNSVPGSPQHRRVEHYRTRYHYTPEPQRRVFGTGPDIQDL